MQIKDHIHCKTAAIHLIIPREQIQMVMGPAIHEILDVLQAQGIPPMGPLFSRHLRLSMEEFDFEVGFPIQGEFRSQGRVYQCEIPTTKKVSRLYQGPYEGLFEAWKQFGEQVQKELPQLGFVRGTGLWESYLKGPETSPNPMDWITELNIPVQ